MDYEKYFEDISAEDLKSAIESETNNIHTVIILTKMLYAKQGMTHSKWEELFHEQKMMQSLTQKGISEHFAKEIVAYSIQAVFGDNGKIGLFVSFDKQDELKCSICPEKPYKVMTIGRQEESSDNREADCISIVVVLCNKHYKRIAIQHDVKLMHSISEYYRTQKEIELV